MRSPSSVLLLHGVASSRTTFWRAQADLDDLGHEVTALDLPGHGTRSAPGRDPARGPATVDVLVRDVLDQVGDRRFDVVVGHSLGAVVTLAAVAARPATAGAVLLEDPPALGGELGVDDVADEVEADVARALTDPAAEVAALLAANPWWASTDAENAVANRRVLDVARVSAGLRASTWHLAALAAACPVPVHLVAATAPGTALVEPGRSALLAALPPARARVVTSGHGIHRDRPGLWLDALLHVLDHPGR